MTVLISSITGSRMAPASFSFDALAIALRWIPSCFEYMPRNGLALLNRCENISSSLPSEIPKDFTVSVLMNTSGVKSRILLLTCSVHIGINSNGGPGKATTVFPFLCTNQPGAVPSGLGMLID